MAWTDYLKVAAAQLRRGSLALGDEVNQLRRQLDEALSNCRQRIHDLEHEVNHSNSVIGHPQTPSARRIEHERRVIDLNHQITDTKQEMREIQDRMASQIRDTENRQTSLSQQAGNLERQAG